MLVQAPAKVNLTLEVLVRRSDGYHGVRSLMVPLELADELAVAPADRFAFFCDREDLAGPENLALRALEALGKLPAVRLELRKRIPTQAGLGGGSSDAAAVLHAAMAEAFGPRPALDWMSVARALGSDVPFFLAQTGALVEGTGERVTPVGALPDWHLLVLKPPAGMSTAAAYAELDRHPRPSRPRDASVSVRAAAALQRCDFGEVEALMHNDFQEPIAAQVPEIAQALQALRAAGAGNATLAGSGSCVFALAPTRGPIDAIVDRLDLPPAYERIVTQFARSTRWLPATAEFA